MYVSTCKTVETKNSRFKINLHVSRIPEGTFGTYHTWVPGYIIHTQVHTLEGIHTYMCVPSGTWVHYNA
jgi:hypothetical protein